MDLQVISLFSGAGGCSLGFQQAGFDIIDSYEIDSDACDTFSKNLGVKCNNIDLNKLDPKDIMLSNKISEGGLDVLIGGPPCQGFSSAGSKYWSDERNYLVYKYIEIIKYLMPKWIVFENVEGILTSLDGDHIVNVANSLIELGFSIKIKKFYSHFYGIPQIRKRVFIVGNRLGLEYEWPEESQNFDGNLRKYDDFLGIDQFLDDLVNTGSDTHVSNLDLDRIKALRPGQNMSHLPKNLQHYSFTERSNRRVADGTSTESRGGAPFGMRRLERNLPSPTITSGSQRELVHYSQDRFLNVSELKRIQTFPDTFEFFGNRASIMQQIGNAIPPKLAFKIANSIIASIEGGQYSRKPGLVSFELTKSKGYSPKLKILRKKLENIMNNEGELFGRNYVSYPQHILQEVSKIYTTAKIHANKILPVKLDDENIKALIGIVCNDLELKSPFQHKLKFELYESRPKEIRESFYGDENIESGIAYFITNYPSAKTYLLLLIRIYQKRYKYDLILSYQPLPTAAQVYSRGILEYYSDEAKIKYLSSLLMWRKWIFDIDNRSAQESGYVFEKLLTECLGGVSYGSKSSPIKRLNRSGNRQVDCIVETTRTAYEFKMRFTIASSGQGRFAEEKSFALEAKTAGYTPVFLVLDPTESSKLTEITKDYEKVGGKCLTGADAWEEIKRNVPDELKLFVLKYIETPVEKLTLERDPSQNLSEMRLKQIGKRIIVTIDDFEFVIERDEKAELGDAIDEET